MLLSHKKQGCKRDVLIHRTIPTETQKRLPRRTAAAITDNQKLQQL